MIISVRTLWAIIGVLFIICAIVIGVIIESRYQSLSNIEQREFWNIANSYDENLDALIARVDTSLQVIGAEIRADTTYQEQQAFMRGIVQQFPELDNIILTDADGMVVMESLPEQASLNLDLSDRQHFLTHTNTTMTQVYLAPPVESRLSGKWIIPISWGVRDRDDNLIGVLMTAIEPSYFASFFGNDTSITGIIYNTDNQILSTIPYDEARIGQLLTDADEITSLENDSSTMAIIEQTPSHLTAHAMNELSGLGWTMTRDRQAMLNQFYEEVAFIVLIGSIIFLNVVLALWVQHRNARRYYEQAEVINLEATQRRLAENAVWKERNLLRTLIDNIPDYIFIKDREGRFIESNRAHTNATGLPYQDILNRRAEDLFASSLAEQFQTDDDTVIQEGATLINEERITVGSDGSQRWVLTTKLPLYDGNNINGLVGISRDITHRRQAEEELRNNERRLRDIISNMPAILIETNRYSLIEMSAGQALNNVDFDADSIQNTSLADLYRPYVEAIDGILEDVLAGKEHNIRMTIDDYIFDTYFIPRIGEDDEINGIISIANDITATLEAEHMRMEFEQERNLLHLKERFIATASHDFRTPLSVIRTKVDLVQHYGERIDAENRSKKMDEILWQVDHMTSLLDNILRLSQANLSAIDLEIQALNLKTFSERVWHDMQETNAKHTLTSFTFNTNIETFYADDHLLQYALINLLHNAFKYTPQDKAVHFTVSNDTEHIIFVIEDKGIGIPEDDLPNLFEPFFRASNSPHGKGKGLGLSIVKAYLDLHNATIDVHSVENESTIVTVSLPILQANSSANN
ncbi:MAG: ATP-binding protein [Chloroflexota bacterium]